MSLLFDTPLIEGLRYAEAAISVGEERELLDRLEPLDLAPFRFHGWLGRCFSALRYRPRRYYCIPAAPP